MSDSYYQPEEDVEICSVCDEELCACYEGFGADLAYDKTKDGD